LKKIEEGQKLEEVGLEVKKAIAPRCGCEFDINNASFSCLELQGGFEDTVLFKARIVVRIPVSVTDADDVVNYINDWVKEEPNITVSLLILTVDPSCSVRVGSEDCITTTGHLTNSDSSSGGAIAGAVTAGVVIVTVVITVVVVIAIYCSKHRRKLR